MSLIKRYMEIQEKREALRRVLKILLETDRLDHDACRGIARKILADGDVDGLSEEQLRIFERHITPFIEVRCENEGCSNVIPLPNLPEAYDNSNDFGGLYCADCTIDMERLNNMQ